MSETSEVQTTMKSPTGTPRRSESGFTLIEAIVSSAVMVIILLALLALLDFNGRVARAQVNVSGMQQSLRAVQSDLVRMTRIAGRGGMPVYWEPNAAIVPAYGGMQIPDGVALAVDNNVADGTQLGGSANAAVVPGTDVLTLRGVMNTLVYQINTAQDGTVPDTGTGSITVRDVSPTGVPQDLQALKDAIADGRPEALLLVSSLSDRTQAVVQLTGGSDNGDHVVLSYTTSTDYLPLSPDGRYPPELTTVASVGILEEYRYYVRDLPSGSRLARARFYPGTDTPYAAPAGGPADQNLTVDLADDILDLQVALGIDRNATEQIEDTGDDTDDWLYNAVADSDDPALWNQAGRPLYYLRLTTLARTDRPDPRYVSPAIDSIEDHVYDEPDEPTTGDERLERSYRRRVLRTVVDLRNL